MSVIVNLSVPVAHLAAMWGDDAEVGRDPVSSFHLHQISCNHLLSVDLHLFSLADHQGLLDHRVTKKDVNMLFGGSLHIIRNHRTRQAIHSLIFCSIIYFKPPSSKFIWKTGFNQAIHFVKIPFWHNNHHKNIPAWSWRWLGSLWYLRDHVLKWFHDLGALSFLEVREAAGDDDNSWQHDTQIQL